MNKPNKNERLNQIADKAVANTVDLWPGIRARVEKTARRQRWMMGAAVIVALALVVVSVAVAALANPPRPVDAQAILNRAQAAAGQPAVTTYHLQVVRHVPVKRNVTITAEEWYGGPDRQRATTQVSDASGAVVSSQDMVYNGTQTWMALSQNGQLNVVRVPGAVLDKPADLPDQQNSLADLLAQYSGGKGCMNAVSQGDGVVAGHATYVIVLTPKPEGCPSPDGATHQVTTPNANDKQVQAGQIAVPNDKQLQAKQTAAANDKQVPANQNVAQVTIWIDKVSFLQLKGETRDTSGALMDSAEATLVEYNIAIPDSMFTYTPPAGATVTTLDGSNGRAVKEALSGAKAPQQDGNTK